VGQKGDWELSASAMLERLDRRRAYSPLAFCQGRGRGSVSVDGGDLLVLSLPLYGAHMQISGLISQSVRSAGYTADARAVFSGGYLCRRSRARMKAEQHREKNQQDISPRRFLLAGGPTFAFAVCHPTMLQRFLR
jgi:hypothetical protein